MNKYRIGSLNAGSKTKKCGANFVYLCRSRGRVLTGINYGNTSHKADMEYHTRIRWTKISLRERVRKSVIRQLFETYTSQLWNNENTFANMYAILRWQIEDTDCFWKIPAQSQEDDGIETSQTGNKRSESELRHSIHSCRESSLMDLRRPKSDRL